jgi:hypothetical protein
MMQQTPARHRAPEAAPATSIRKFSVVVERLALGLARRTAEEMAAQIKATS